MKTRGGKSPHFTDRSMTELMTVSRKTPVINIMCHISNMKQHAGHKQALDRFLQLWEKEKCGKIQMGGVMKLVLTFVQSSQE